MNNEQLKKLVEVGSSFTKGRFDDRQKLADWNYDVEAFLKKENLLTKEIVDLFDGIKNQGNVFGRVPNVVAYLKQLDKTVQLPPMTERAQIFVAMWFTDEMDEIYNTAYEPVIEALDYIPMRIDKKEYNDSIMDEIYREIPNSVALIADLTGNRGGVYHEAGIARGLKLCKHPIEIIFTCKKDYFIDPDTKPHFDVQGNKIIVYSDVKDLRGQLKARIQHTVGTSIQIPPTTPALTDTAKRLLKETSKDSNGWVSAMQSVVGFHVSTNGKEFCENQEPREIAKWKRVIDELVAAKLIAAPNGRGHEYSITDLGYEIADTIEEVLVWQEF